MDNNGFNHLVKRIKEDKEHFTNIEGPIVTPEGADEIIFDVEYLSLDELDTIKKRLRIHLMHATKDMPPQLQALIDNKVSICELKKCPTCGNEEWKNVTREINIKILGGSVRGW